MRVKSRFIVSRFIVPRFIVSRFNGARNDKSIRAPLLIAANLVLGLLAIYLLFFHRLAARDLWSSHEARAAMDAQTILEDGVWGLPRLYDGRWELQKPPLYYWLTACLGWLRGGVDAWAVRLPAALAAAWCVVLVGVGLAFGRQRRSEGILAAAILATAAHFTWLARIGRIDMPLTLCVTASLGGLYLARDRSRGTRWALLAMAYGGIAAGVMLKGPIGLVLPVAVMSVHLLWELGPPTPQRRRSWFAALGELGVWWGLPLVAALVLPWVVWVHRATEGEWFRVFIWHHNLERGYGGSTLRANPWWFYFPQLLGDFLPWSFVLPLAGWWSYRRGLWRGDAEARFGLIWFATIFLLLSCSRFKRADYLLPAYPGLAVFLGCTGRAWLSQQKPQAQRYALRIFATVVGVTLAVWLLRVEWQLPAREPYRDYRAFAARIRELAPRPEEIVFFRTEAHPLAFHLGRPLTIVVQWQELQARLRQPGTHYVVTPPGCVEESQRNLPGIPWERVLDNTALSGGAHERPLVLLRAGAAVR